MNPECVSGDRGDRSCVGKANRLRPDKCSTEGASRVEWNPPGSHEIRCVAGESTNTTD
jgi:hypothetical protein